SALARRYFREALAGIVGFENAIRRRQRDGLGIVRVHRERIRIAFQALGGGALPVKAVVQRVVKAGLLHAGVGRRVPDVDGVGVPARRRDMKGAFALEPALVPVLATIVAPQKAGGILEDLA